MVMALMVVTILKVVLAVVWGFLAEQERGERQAYIHFSRTQADQLWYSDLNVLK